MTLGNDRQIADRDVENASRPANDRQVQRERNFYDDRWKNYGKPERDRERIDLTCAAIPAGCNRILDLGCGDGRLSQRISKDRECLLISFDLSMLALRQNCGPRCCGSASELPFPDRSFDLVLTTEMLEHLPAAVYGPALAEISRVATKYVLITVPNEENLRQNLARCTSCGNQFHVWGHQRSYSISALEGIFDRFRLIRAFDFGDEVQAYNPALLWLRQRVAGAYAWEEQTVCSACHAASRQAPRSRFLVRACDGLNTRFWGPFFKRSGWLLGLYARREL